MNNTRFDGKFLYHQVLTCLVCGRKHPHEFFFLGAICEDCIQEWDGYISPISDWHEPGVIYLGTVEDKEFIYYSGGFPHWISWATAQEQFNNGFHVRISQFFEEKINSDCHLLCGRVGDW